jgi:hypothetical protein
MLTFSLHDFNHPFTDLSEDLPNIPFDATLVYINEISWAIYGNVFHAPA